MTGNTDSQRRPSLRGSGGSQRNLRSPRTLDVPPQPEGAWGAGHPPNAARPAAFDLRRTSPTPAPASPGDSRRGANRPVSATGREATERVRAAA